MESPLFSINDSEDNDAELDFVDEFDNEEELFDKILSNDKQIKGFLDDKLEEEKNRMAGELNRSGW